MKKSQRYIYVIAVVFLLLLVPQSRKAIASGIFLISEPIVGKISDIARSSHGFFSGIGEISNIRHENSELVKKIKELQIDKTELEELRYENEVLKNQLGFAAQHQENNLVPARIIGREPFGTLDKITIDKGAKDGIDLKAAVVSNGSLVGRVSDVYDNQSKVMLITSKDSTIQAMLQNSRTLGIIKGSIRGVKLENIPQDTEIGDKEAIVTSGLGGEISAGILIGWAKGVASTKSEIYKIVDMELAEDLNKLEFVFVVK